MLGRRRVGEHGDRRGLDRAHHGHPRLVRARHVLVHVLGVGPWPGAVGDDRGQLRAACSGLEHHLAADREADAGDALGIDVGPVLEEPDRRVDVAVPAPAPGVRLAVAAALAAAVEEQHAVAVPGEHARLLLRAAPAGEGDDGGAVARRDVPALELEPVARLEGHVLVGDAQVVVRHDGARRVRGDVAEPDREEHEHEGHGARDAEQPTPGVPPRAVAHDAAGPPQPDDAEPEQRERRGDDEQAGEVVAGRPGRPRVVERLARGDDAEHAGHERQRAAPAATEARVRPGGQPEHGQRDEAADEVVAGRGARLGLHEVVVDHVQRDQGDPDPEDEGLTRPAAPPRERRSGGDGGPRDGRGHRWPTRSAGRRAR